MCTGNRSERARLGPRSAIRGGGGSGGPRGVVVPQEKSSPEFRGGGEGANISGYILQLKLRWILAPIHNSAVHRLSAGPSGAQVIGSLVAILSPNSEVHYNKLYLIYNFGKHIIIILATSL